MPMMNEEDFYLQNTFDKAKREVEKECRDFGIRLIDFSVVGKRKDDVFNYLDFVVKVDITGMRKSAINSMKEAIDVDIKLAYSDSYDRRFKYQAGKVEIVTIGKAKGFFG